MDSGTKVLNSRYELVWRIAADDVSESWIGVDEYQSEYLVKLWPFEGASPGLFQRALWDAELRIMYRVGSSPGADGCILIIHDAGVDREQQCFAMVLEAQASGYETLAVALANRSAYPWLRNRDVHRDMESRHELWLGLQRLANGLHILHEQNVLHRNVRPEAVFLKPERGTASFRLGGFEWSLRLGVPALKSLPQEMHWTSPPEFFSDRPAYRPETDWYAFGVLATRCLLDVESYGILEPIDRHQRIAAALSHASNSLSDLEQEFLRNLTAPDSRDRLTHWPRIRRSIVDILDKLEVSSSVSRDVGTLVLTINPSRSVELADKAREFGFQADPDSPDIPYSPVRAMHVARLKEFLQQDLANAQLYTGANDNMYVINGRYMALRISPYRDSRTRISSWDVAYAEGTGSVFWREGNPAPVALPEGRIAIWTTQELWHS